jgi:hypothetical protein
MSTLCSSHRPRSPSPAEIKAIADRVESPANTEAEENSDRRPRS